MAGEYAAYTDIQSEFKSLTFTSSTNPSQSVVEGFISQASAKINSIVQKAYNTPVSSTVSPNSSLLLKEICIKLVKYRIEKVLRLQTGTKLEQEEPANLRKEAIDDLNELVDDKLLADAVLKTTGGSGVEDYNYNNSIEQSFDVTKEQW